MKSKKAIVIIALVLIFGLCIVYTVCFGGELVTVNTEKITQGGTYTYSGTINGKIKVEAPDEEVTIILAGVTITNTQGACIKVESASAVTIIAQEGTENYLYAGNKSNPQGSGSCINSYADLTIDGSGSLYVYGYDNNGIHAQENLTILGSSIYLESYGDGIQADDSMNILGGNISISAGDDGIHAENSLVIESADIDITKSEEGIEAVHITVNSGNISVAANDDGFNANGGTSLFGFGGGFGGFGRGGSQSSSSSSDDMPSLTINGGTIYVYAKGDGLDSNGDLIVNGGTVVVDGPSNSANGALDSGSENGGSLLVNGGKLLAVGASGMAETPDSDSTQNYISASISFSSGDTIKIVGSDGSVLFTHTTKTSGNSIIYSDASIADSETLTVYVNSTSVAASEGQSSGYGGFGGFGGGSMGGGGMRDIQKGGGTGGSRNNQGGSTQDVPDIKNIDPEDLPDMGDLDSEDIKNFDPQNIPDMKDIDPEDLPDMEDFDPGSIFNFDGDQSTDGGSSSGSST